MKGSNDVPSAGIALITDILFCRLDQRFRIRARARSFRCVGKRRSNDRLKKEIDQTTWLSRV